MIGERGVLRKSFPGLPAAKAYLPYLGFAGKSSEGRAEGTILVPGPVKLHPLSINRNFELGLGAVKNGQYQTKQDKAQDEVT
jgi:hypothetical protein